MRKSFGFTSSAFYFVSASIFILSPSVLAAGRYTAQIQRTRNHSPGLVFGQTTLDVHRGGDNQPSVTLQWAMRPGWTFSWIGGSNVGPTNPARGTREVTLIAPSISLSARVTSPQGQSTDEKIYIVCSDWQSARAEMLARPQPSTRAQPAAKAYALSTGLGVTSLSYAQPGKELSEIALTPKLSYLRNGVLGPNIALALNTFYSYPISSNIAGTTLSYWGVNFRLAYAVPAVKSPWRLTLSAGAYYTTTSASGEKLGFLNMIGPQAFISLRYALSSINSMGSYLKYAMVQNSGTGGGFSNREIAIGGDYTHRLSSGRSISFLLDYADLSAVVTGVPIANIAVSGSVGYNW